MDWDYDPIKAQQAEELAAEMVNFLSSSSDDDQNVDDRGNVTNTKRRSKPLRTIPKEFHQLRNLAQIWKGRPPPDEISTDPIWQYKPHAPKGKNISLENNRNAEIEESCRKNLDALLQDIEAAFIADTKVHPPNNGSGDYFRGAQNSAHFENLPTVANLTAPVLEESNETAAAPIALPASADLTLYDGGGNNTAGGYALHPPHIEPYINIPMPGPSPYYEMYSGAQRPPGLPDGPNGALGYGMIARNEMTYMSAVPNAGPMPPPYYIHPPSTTTNITSNSWGFGIPTPILPPAGPRELPNTFYNETQYLTGFYEHLVYEQMVHQQQQIYHQQTYHQQIYQQQVFHQQMYHQQIYQQQVIQQQQAEAAAMFHYRQRQWCSASGTLGLANTGGSSVYIDVTSTGATEEPPFPPRMD